jgi:uncharacterized protein (TIGR03066 family)
MRTLRPLLAVCLALVLVGIGYAQPKASEAIVGKWEPQDPNAKGKATLEFLKDGKMKIAFGDIMIDGTYKFVSDDTMEVKMTFGGETKTEKIKVKVSDKEMEFTPSNGKTEKFSRLK